MAEECSHECGSCGVSVCGERTAAGPTKLETNKRSNVKHVIGVVSGKGGVGKSLVTSLLASEMNKRGNKVGILDADITGPSIPKTFGITNPLTADADGILPGQTQTGIKVMSTNLMLPKGDLPVAWRGPVVSNAIRQFWSETNWGDIDYMFIDMPPGTGDVPLTVFQSLPVDAIIIVTSPQELVSMIVGKAVKMAAMMQIPILGLIENYSYFQCPDNGKKYHIFGPSHLQAAADAYGLKILAELPIDPDLAAACDSGNIENYQTNILDNVINILKNTK